MSRHARAPSFLAPAFVALVLVVGGPARPSEPAANEEVTCPIETRHDPDDGTTRLYVSGTLVAEGMELGGGRDPYEARVACWRLGGGRVLVASPAPRLIEVSCAEPKARKLFYGEADADFLTAVEVDGGRGLVFGARRGLRVLDLATATARKLVPAVKLSAIVSGCESSAGDVALFRPASTSPDGRHPTYDLGWPRPGALGVHVGTHNREGSLADATPPVRVEVHPDGLWERRAGGPSRRVFGARELEAAEPGRALLRRAGLASPAAWNEDPVVRGEADEHNLAGLAHHRKERWDEAIGAYLEATRRDPSHVWARYNLACAWARSAEPELSLAALSELVDELCLGGVLHDEERCRTLVRKAGKDADFAALAADPRLTGILGTAVRAPFRAPR